MVLARVAVVGAGWAGLSAAVHATLAGHDVRLLEMAARAGGRARSVDLPAGRFDNGQHILVGAYRETLALMHRVGVDPAHGLLREGLDLRQPDGRGLRLPTGAGPAELLRAVLTASGWTVRERFALAARAIRWRATGFRCPPDWTVDRLAAGLPRRILEDLVEPLCVSALNTPARAASAAVFLRVIRDSLFGGNGSADLLLARMPLSQLLAEPASAWLADHGTEVRHRYRVARIEPDHAGWRVDGEHYDAVVLAASAREASRLVQPIDPSWSRMAGRIEYQPIATVWLFDPGLGWPRPMMALRSSEHEPAQFGFDLGALGGPRGHFAFVVSAASSWADRGLDAVASAVLDQARRAFPGAFAGCRPMRHAHVERRATFACTPSMSRPSGWIARGLVAAGDYVDGPYPATLEGAVRSGRLAAAALVLDAGAAGGTARLESDFAMRE